MGLLDAPALSLSQAKAAAGIGLKRGALVVSACGGQGPSSSLGVGGTGANIVNAVRSPVTTQRWRPHIQNYNYRDAVAYAGQVAFNGLWISDFTDVATGWDGKAKAVPAQVYSSWTATDLSTEYVGAWVTDPALQLKKGVGHNLSFGYTAAAGVQVGRGYAGSFYTTNQADAPFQGSNRIAYEGSVFDIWIEYEAYTDAPMCLVLGNSLDVGRHGSGDPGVGMISSWPGIYANRTKTLVTNASLSGSTLGIWTSAFSPRMSRWSGFTWDSVFIGSPTNNVDNGESLATIQTSMATTVGAAKTAYPGARIYVATIPPRTWAGDSTAIAAKDLVRPQVNLWLQSLPLGVHGCLRLDDPALLGSANRLSSDIDCGDGVHMKTIGYQIMANAVPGRI